MLCSLRSTPAMITAQAFSFYVGCCGVLGLLPIAPGLASSLSQNRVPPVIAARTTEAVAAETRATEAIATEAIATEAIATEARPLLPTQPLKLGQALPTSPNFDPSHPLTPQPAVHQLQTITPDHWAAQALDTLADRYNCPTPDIRVTSQNGLSRSDFALLIDRCLDHLQQTHPLFQTADGTSPYVSRTQTQTDTPIDAASLNRGALELELGASGQNSNQARSSILDPAFAEVRGVDLVQPPLDFVTLQRLQTEFAPELQALGDRIDTQAERVQTLEDQQFSQRTKLFGIASFSTATVWGSQQARTNPQQPAQDLTAGVPFGGNVSLSFDTRFRQQDLLRLQIGAGSVPNTGRPLTGTTMSTVPLGANTTDENLEGASIVLQSLWYQTRFADRGLVRFGPVGISTIPLAGDLNPVNSTSAFGKRNPLHLVAGGGGVAANYQFNDSLSAAASYTSVANDGFSPEAGIFLGRYSLFSQLLFTPNQRLGLGLSHVYHSNPGDRVNLTAGRGSALAQSPFGNNTPTTAHLLGLELEASLSRNWALGAWVGYNWAWASGDGAIGRQAIVSGATASSWNYALTLNLQDLGKRGSQLGFVVGMPPKAIHNSIAHRTDLDTTYHLEVLYRYRHSSYLAFTPGLILLLNPEHNANNPAIWIASFATTLQF